MEMKTISPETQKSSPQKVSRERLKSTPPEKAGDARPKKKLHFEKRGSSCYAEEKASKSLLGASLKALSKPPLKERGEQKKTEKALCGKCSEKGAQVGRKRIEEGVGTKGKKRPRKKKAKQKGKEERERGGWRKKNERKKTPSRREKEQPLKNQVREKPVKKETLQKGRKRKKQLPPIPKATRKETSERKKKKAKKSVATVDRSCVVRRRGEGRRKKEGLNRGPLHK